MFLFYIWVTSLPLWEKPPLEIYIKNLCPNHVARIVKLWIFLTLLLKQKKKNLFFFFGNIRIQLSCRHTVCEARRGHRRSTSQSQIDKCVNRRAGVVEHATPDRDAAVWHVTLLILPCCQAVGGRIRMHPEWGGVNMYGMRKGPRGLLVGDQVRFLLHILTFESTMYKICALKDTKKNLTLIYCLFCIFLYKSQFFHLVWPGVQLIQNFKKSF